MSDQRDDAEDAKEFKLAMIDALEGFAPGQFWVGHCYDLGMGVDEDEQSRRQESAQKLYQRRAFTPDRVAAAIVRAVETNQAVVPVSPEAVGMQWLGRFTPSLARNLAQVELSP